MIRSLAGVRPRVNSLVVRQVLLGRPMNGGAASGAILFYHRYPLISTGTVGMTRLLRHDIPVVPKWIISTLKTHTSGNARSKALSPYFTLIPLALQSVSFGYFSPSAVFNLSLVWSDIHSLKSEVHSKSRCKYLRIHFSQKRRCRSQKARFNWPFSDQKPLCE